MHDADAPRACHCVIHEYLAASVFKQLVTLVVQRQGLFKSSTREHHDERVLDELESLRDPLAGALLDAMTDVAPRCGLLSFSPAQVDMRVVSRGNSTSSPARGKNLDNQAIGFVLFLHREPRPFEGGTLHLHSLTGETIIEPSQNSIVFFPGSIETRAGEVRVASAALIDSLLTLEGRIRTDPDACARV
jgi:hypothetical protein